MLAITVEFLSGRYVATAYNDRERVEWPPHPGRLFSALVAAWADGDLGTPEYESERSALLWLEQRPAPAIFASSIDDVGVRTAVPVFVPVNDVNVVSFADLERIHEHLALLRHAEGITPAKLERESAKLARRLANSMSKAIEAPARFAKGDAGKVRRLLPESRARQQRYFPSAHPRCPRVAFVWDVEDPGSEIVGALGRLATRLVRLGHSSSFVHGAVANDGAALESWTASTARFEPDDMYGTHALRWVGSGQLEALGHAFERHRETEPRVMPATHIRYRSTPRATQSPLPHSVFDDDFIVFERHEGPRLPSVSAVGVARQFRRALMSVAEQPVPELLSGHKADGSPSDSPHLAIVPLPFVGAQHADGALLGVALVTPVGLSANDRFLLMRAIGALERASVTSDGAAPTGLLELRLGQAGVLTLRRLLPVDDRPVTLRSSSWCRASRAWASVTPVALDRNPGDLHGEDHERRARAFAEATDYVRRALDATGLPGAQASIDVTRSAVVGGTAKPRAFPRFPVAPDRPQRVLVHVRVSFPSPVRGPILLGAGRYHGLGLLLPVDDSRQSVGR